MAPAPHASDLKPARTVPPSALLSVISKTATPAGACQIVPPPPGPSVSPHPEQGPGLGLVPNPDGGWSGSPGLCKAEVAPGAQAVLRLA